jgi:hypothetical protein
MPTLTRSSRGKLLKETEGPTFKFFTDADEQVNQRRKRSKTSKRALKVSSVPALDFDKENVLASSSSFCSSSSSNNSRVGFKKTIEISVEEKAMKGAPEGDLFDVRLLSDEEILPSSNPQYECRELVEKHRTLTTWADLYAAVEGFRRMALHHSHLLDDNP